MHKLIPKQMQVRIWDEGQPVYNDEGPRKKVKKGVLEYLREKC